MTTPLDIKGSARKPIPIPPLRVIIREGSDEIRQQIDEAVEKAVTAGIAVDPVRLRKWGPKGAEYFARTLQERIMPTSMAVVAKSEPSSTALKTHHFDTTTGSRPEEPPRRPAPVVTTEKDWMHQECNRWSIATRAIFRGMIVAMSLLLLAIAMPRIWS